MSSTGVIKKVMTVCAICGDTVRGNSHIAMDESMCVKHTDAKKMLNETNKDALRRVHTTYDMLINTVDRHVARSV